MTQRKKTILGVLYGTELFGRERENIECYKTLPVARLACASIWVISRT